MLDGQYIYEREARVIWVRMAPIGHVFDGTVSEGLGTVALKKKV